MRNAARAAILNEDHRQRHIKLHTALDELVADWVLHQPRGKLFSNSTITDRMESPADHQAG